MYDATGKCRGMLTSKRFNILFTAFYDTKFARIHDTIITFPKSFAFELLGILSRSALHNNKTHTNTKIEYSHMCALPSHFHSALQKWALVPQGKMASPLNHNPNYFNF